MDDSNHVPPPFAHFPPPDSGISRRAVIDVGTNSVKVLVADLAGRIVTPLWEQSEQTRLGQGFYAANRLQAGAIAQTAAAVAQFARLAARWHCASTRVIATSAARDAINQIELLAAIQQMAGLPVEVLSGEQEADWTFSGVTSDPALAGQPLLILDVGGGSTEFIVGEGSRQRFRQSFSLGTVRWLELLPLSDPPLAGELQGCQQRLRDYLKQQVRPGLAPVLQSFSERSVQLVGTGGTTTILARIQTHMTDFDRDRIEATRLTREQVGAHVERLWRLPLAERKKIVGLPPKRADVILMGAAIFEAIMEEFGFPEVRVSTRGLRYGAVLSAAGAPPAA